MNSPTIYSTGIIIDPQWGVMPCASMKQLSLFQHEIRIGKEDIPLSTIDTLVVNNKGCLILKYKRQELCFAVQARYGPGKIDEQATIWLKDLIFSLQKGDNVISTHVVDKLRQKKRNDSLLIAANVLFVLILGSMGGLLFKQIANQPTLLFLFLIALIVGHISISVFFRVLNRRLAGETLTWRWSLSCLKEIKNHPQKHRNSKQ